ncbi:unnamed protein product [Heligmosomoides polygyrus]|uniref:HTH_48 domain-containing protein n=1 Tax=Heligmosomoides polygyrus TaxID=6339 RepID=A0A183FQK8_HELPZ|nr:unnamed protein product [Heligmosomoides polygyrus]
MGYLYLPLLSSYFVTTTAEEIVLDCRQVRLLLLDEFKKQSSARAAMDNACGTMGPTIVSYDTAKVWFQKFKNGHFCLEDQPRFRRPVAVKEERLLERFRRISDVAPVDWQRNSSAATPP